jgi:hypothetical protein
MGANGKAANGAAANGRSEPEIPRRKMSMFTILGWASFVSCLIPFSMMPPGRTSSREVLLGLGLIVVGAVLLAIGHAKRNYE